MDKKNKKFIFVTNSDETNGYKLSNPITKKLIIRRDVKFYKNNFWE